MRVNAGRKTNIKSLPPTSSIPFTLANNVAPAKIILGYNANTVANVNPATNIAPANHVAPAKIILGYNANTVATANIVATPPPDALVNVFSKVGIGSSLVSEGKTATSRSAGTSIHSLSSKAPPFVPFTQLSSIINLLYNLQQSQSQSFGIVKRSVRKTLAALSCRPLIKPHAFHVEDMFVPEMFQGGGSPLSPHERSLDVVAMDRFHIAACTRCSASGFVLDSCYWS